MTFEDFATARLPALLRYATVLTNDPHLAEDIVQEVLLKVHRKWKRVRDAPAPEAYVHRMVTNQFLSWRRRRSWNEAPRSPQQMIELGTAANDAMTRVDDRDELLARIARLPGRQRVALVLRYFSDLPDEQIAGLMGCRVVTVRSHISRALSTLRITPALEPVSNGDDR
ncbi:SigE family RNA polymerase sigma factor [Actinocrispum sp. NPDC049592]|uniref:SigE family RNA polymerase sigma factor n=1 Tax=Actinocrispum sp. NPDC049592 TaxID=3154835 RepID=UPI0034471953